MNNDTLFNCCPNNQAPDWTQFTALEIGGCVTLTMENGDTLTEGGQTMDEAEFFTVYGHCTWGGCEAITDCKTYDDAKAVSAELTRLSGLQVTFGPLVD